MRALLRQKLSKTDRDLFIAYYHDASNIPKQRRRLALRLNVSIEALYKRMSRMKAQLEKQRLRARESLSNRFSRS